MALQAENYALEKQVHTYQVSTAKTNGTTDGSAANHRQVKTQIEYKPPDESCDVYKAQIERYKSQTELCDAYKLQTDLHEAHIESPDVYKPPIDAYKVQAEVYGAQTESRDDYKPVPRERNMACLKNNGILHYQWIIE